MSLLKRIEKGSGGNEPSGADSSAEDSKINQMRSRNRVVGGEGRATT